MIQSSKVFEDVLVVGALVTFACRMEGEVNTEYLTGSVHLTRHIIHVALANRKKPR